MTEGLRLVPESRRVEALRRLDVVGDDPDPTLHDLMALVRDLLGADAAALTLVAEARARMTAVTDRPDPVDLPRGATLADVAVRAGPQAAVRRDDPCATALGAHPWCRDGVHVATVVAASVPAPDGSAIGAVELAWRGPGRVPDAWEELAGRGAVQIGRWLERRAEAQEYRRFVELAPDAIAILDLEGAVELVNPAMVRLWGGTEDQLIGRSFLDLAAPVDLARVTGALARVLSSRERSASFDVQLRRCDGTFLPVSVNAGHLRGSRRSLQLVVRDLSDRIRAEAERARLTEQLAQAHRFETVGQLAGGLAHDINNLLTVLTSSVYLSKETVAGLERGEPLEEGLAALREEFEALHEASSRVGGLTQRLMRFANPRPPLTEEIDVAATLRSMATLLVRSLGADVELEVEVAEDIPYVEVDPGRLEQAVTNLVLNARDAMPDGGVVRLVARAEVRDAPAGGVPRGQVTIAVSDHGVGMDDAVLARAFEPLFTTKDPDHGTGLGLATVLRFVEDAGGDLHIDTAVGHGTEVSLSLPAVRNHPAATGPRVVLLEPGDRSRRVIGAMLTGAGYRIEACTDLDGVRTASADGDVTVVIAALDGDPVIDVEGLVAELRHRDPDLPLVLLVSDATDEHVPDDVTVVHKPFASERLLAEVATAVGIPTEGA